MMQHYKKYSLNGDTGSVNVYIIFNVKVKCAITRFTKLTALYMYFIADFMKWRIFLHNFSINLPHTKFLL